MSDCGICGSSAVEFLMEARDADSGEHRFMIDRCTVCGHAALRDAPTDAQLGRYYETDYYGQGRFKFSGPFQFLFDLTKGGVAARVLRHAPADGRTEVLDVGCGTGQLLFALQRRGASATGVERSGRAGHAAHPGLRILEGELGELDLRPAGFDAVVIWHALEHLRDPMSVLRKATELLRPGGVLLIAVPNIASWQAAMFGRHWFHLDVPRHLQFFAHESLQRMVVAEGYRLASSSTMQFSQSLFGFVQSACNMLFQGRPNRLYGLMRCAQGVREHLELGAWLLLAVILAPIGAVELLASWLFGRGAVSTLMATRR